MVASTGAESFSVDAFECGNFRWMDSSPSGRPNWVVFYNWDPLQQRPRTFDASESDAVKLYHGTTLSQCQTILAEGFSVGLHHKGSKSSPCGIWGCDSPGHAFDRVPLSRGWSTIASEDIVCGWDCPVAFGWSFPSHALMTHKHLQTGKVYVHKLPQGTLWDVNARRTEIWIHRGLFERFKVLPTAWVFLLHGHAVVCRARLGTPSDLYRAGHSAPMTCGRICDVREWEAEGWQKASDSKQFFCPSCRHNSLLCRPSTGI
jgi:hypothetical protein